MAKSTSNTPVSAAQERHGAAAGLKDQVGGLMDSTIALRRNLHKWPEIGNSLPKTREQVLSALEGLPLDITLHETTSGIAAMLTGGKPGPTVMLRGDMDALPMPEDTDLDFASKTENCMHACGHDTHTSMLVSTAKLLSDRRSEIPGRVLFMFQPGEEGYHGAKFMLDEGLLNVSKLKDGSDSPIKAAYALHITSSMPAGTVGTRSGPVMASSDTLSITITGKGGHASEPFRTLDPIPVACEIVQALQMMITRRIETFDPAVVTITKLIAGTTTNVIPETAKIEGTIRAVSEKTRNKVHDSIRRVAEGIAATYEMQASVEIKLGYPVTVNDAPSVDFALDVAESLLGEGKAVHMPSPIMGAEDFSYVLNQIPGAMVFLGGTPEGLNPATAPPNHSNRVMFDEASMAHGVALYSSLALRTLGVTLN
ncbi:MAG: amidohydrolase [Ilumatobacteraceae bacterium]|jgi:hippurate hydrolase|nr:amidohydrolase [Ilumatobacteraceae bacterium]